MQNFVLKKPSGFFIEDHMNDTGHNNEGCCLGSLSFPMKLNCMWAILQCNGERVLKVWLESNHNCDTLIEAVSEQIHFRLFRCQEIDTGYHTGNKDILAPRGMSQVSEEMEQDFQGTTL